jgi:hypothetical protein
MTGTKFSSVGSRRSLSVGPDKTWSPIGSGEDVMGTVNSCVKKLSDIGEDVMDTVHSCVKESSYGGQRV